MPSYEYRDVSSQSIVWVNSKTSAYNVKKLEYDAVAEIGEGLVIAKDLVSGKGRLATSADTVVFVNFYSTARMSARDYQIDPLTDDTAIPLKAGGLSGIEGASIELGIPLSLWDVARTPVAGDYVGVDAGHFLAIDPAAVTGIITFGTVQSTDGASRVIIHFESIGVLNA